MSRTAVHRHDQDSRYASPWSLKIRIKQMFWQIAWTLFCAWTPKPLNAWRLFWLRRFGCRIHGVPFVHQKARVHSPWNLILHDRACLGDGANAYALGEIEIGEGATVAQEAYLCTGTHDFSIDSYPLCTARIFVGADAFVGMRAIVLPGVSIGERSVVGAGSVVTQSVARRCTVAGNPARDVRRRQPVQSESVDYGENEV